MALTGIILQALAGMVYGASYLIGVERMDKWQESKKAWLAESRNRVKVSYFLTFLAPLAMIISLYSLEENDIQWYFLILGFLCSWALIVVIYTGFLLFWSKSKSIPDLMNNPRVNQMVQRSNIASLIIGIILMILGGVGLGRLGGEVIGNNIGSSVIPVILLTLALAGLNIGFILVLMPAIYYLCVLFVNGVTLLLRPGKALWILALSLFLAGSGCLMASEICKLG